MAGLAVARDQASDRFIWSGVENENRELRCFSVRGVFAAESGKFQF